MFTGDRSGDILYRVLHRTGFASMPASTSREDGLVLRDLYITAAAHCAPPGNKPEPGELRNCRPFLERELDLLKEVKVVVALGKIAFDVYLDILKARGVIASRSGFVFGHDCEFVTAPGRPNLYGLVQGDANAVRPGARMLSSMSPVVAWRGGETIALGSRGGSRIPTVITQVLLNLIVDGDSLQMALDRPRIHHQWLPDEIVAEKDALSPDEMSGLIRRGHNVRPSDGLGEVAAVRVFTNSRMEAAADTRRNPGGADVLAAREAPGTAGPVLAGQPRVSQATTPGMPCARPRLK